MKSAYPDRFDVMLPVCNSDELLVQDGVAKLLLLWLLWETARAWRAGLFREGNGWQELGKKISDRINLTKAGDTANKKWGKWSQSAPDDLATSTSPGVIVDFERLRELFTSNAPGNVQLAVSSLEGFIGKLHSQKSMAGDHLLDLMEKLKFSVWRGINLTPIKESLFRGLQGGSRVDKIADSNRILLGRSYVARMFWGAVGSIERTDRPLSDLGLNGFQSVPSGHSPWASPIPQLILLRWGKLLCFGPIASDDQDSPAQQAWTAFCGHKNSETGRRGTSVGEFAGALVDSLSREVIDQHEMRGREKVDIPSAGNNFEASKSRDESELQKSAEPQLSAHTQQAAPEQPKRPTPAPVRAFDVYMVGPDQSDRITLRVTSDAMFHLRIDAFSYMFPTTDAVPADGDRVIAVKAIRVMWNFGSSAFARFQDVTCVEDFQSHLQFLNEGDVELGGPPPTLDADRAKFSLRRRDGEAFPIQRTSIKGWRLPLADFSLDKEHKLEFWVHRDDLGIFIKVGSGLRPAVAGDLTQPQRSEHQSILDSVLLAEHEYSMKDAPGGFSLIGGRSFSIMAPEPLPKSDD
jgi:hypothetical protein